ncbi:MAG: class I SAM-dependent methyltransferase [Firmicutes bacterium]|nr:class I SAM-dependent methyltransferase [Bacillota bacterium]
MWGVAIVALVVAGWVAVRLEGQMRPRPMPARFERFFLNNPFRRWWFGPQHVLKALGPLAGLQVAEVGVGTGVVLEALSRAVGPSGRTYGIDIQPQAVAMASQRLASRSLSAELAVARATELPWPSHSLDRVVMVAVFGEIPPYDRPRALAEVRRVLSPAGLLAITEFWPDPHYQPRERLVPYLEKNGWRVERVVGNAAIYTALARPN